MEGGEEPRKDRRFQSTVDFGVTLLLWSYFTAGFLFFFSPFYLCAFFFSANRERSFQRLNSRFYRVFFALTRLLLPGHRWRVSPAVAGIRSSVVVCNHRSYLDSIFLISLYEKHNTIVKSRLMDIPVFGRMLQLSGYLPSSAEGRFGEMMFERIEGMDRFLNEGGNLIIFPEGTRTKTGRIGRLNKGAFKLARRCRVPIAVLFIRNTEKMFRPGSFSFDTRGPNTIHLELIGRIDAEEVRAVGDMKAVMARVRTMLENENDKKRLDTGL